MANTSLTAAMRAKNDEFFTQYADIEKEINAYLEYNADVFRGKTILLPCDDPEWSNFTKFFAQNFEAFGLKKLISTSYADASKNYQSNYQPSLFEKSQPKFDKKKTKVKGKIFTLDEDSNRDGKINVDDLKWEYLEGDGDFRSAEVKKLRDEADIIITNPPFSLFREFLAWTVKAKKLFVVIGSISSISYKEIFPLVKRGKIWLGNGFHAGNAYFATPFAEDYGEGVYNAETDLVKFRNVCWLTNIDHGRRHQPLPLMTTEENLKYSKHKEIKGKESYDRYDNYDAIDVPFIDSIPSDCDGIMGVPVSFLDKHCPEQFEILGMTDRDSELRTKVYTRSDSPKYSDLNRRGAIKVGNEYKPTFARLLIRKRTK